MLTSALSHLERLHRERENLRKANGRIHKAIELERRSKQNSDKLRSHQVKLNKLLEAAVHEREAIDEKVTAAKTVLQEIQKRAKCFNDLAKEKNCSYCGQPLSPAHIRTEKIKLKQDSVERKEAYEDALGLQRVARAKETQFKDEMKVTS